MLNSCRLLPPLAVALSTGACAALNTLPEGSVSISVTERTGRVLIIREPSYVVATPGIEVNIGDRIATLAKASATLRYALLDTNGAETGKSCQLDLPPNSQLLVTGGGDCRQPSISALNADE